MSETDKPKVDRRDAGLIFNPEIDKRQMDGMVVVIRVFKERILTRKAVQEI